ncbi:MAG: imidazoleglycerol-phosphate dehydratase HisB [Christensenellaceae bacterium]|nr:imidazoleglycerol-phosphate dehydratase HisB [Christensenellaceae bacterium]
MRQASVERITKETQIKLSLNLDGKGVGEINTGIGFLDHMLRLFSAHSRIDLNVDCKGDTYIDYHHSVEDIGISLGLAIKQALGDFKGIYRYGNACIPMDEALVNVALDISGRCYLNYGITNLNPKAGSFDTELVQEFFEGLCRALGLTLHIVQFAGTNTHHIIECAFKAFARAIKIAVAIDPTMEGEIPSTKGVIQN